MAVRHACLLRAVSMGGPNDGVRRLQPCFTGERAQVETRTRTSLELSAGVYLQAWLWVRSIRDTPKRSPLSSTRSYRTNDSSNTRSLLVRTYKQRFLRDIAPRRRTSLPSFGILSFFILAGTLRTISERCVEALCNRISSTFRDRSTPLKPVR